ncbi:MAG: 60S ribosomal protein L31 [Candidatus Aenigmarchaeota archaeon]|nr:60S ribosomal protein L31 [Candidatus Aenigmarchaeota archaeon]
METILTINLRKQLVKTPKWDRSDAATKILKEILRKKTKAEKVKISKGLNEFIWKFGIKNPPTKVRVKITTTDKLVTADIMS